MSSSFVFMASGGAVVYLLNGILSWRLIAMMTVAIAVSGFAQSFFIPETKYWHLLHNDKERAIESILWFQPNMNTAELDRKMNPILRSIEEDPNAKSGHFMELIKNLRYKKYYKPVLLGLTVTFLRSGNGRTIFGIYLINIFEYLQVPYSVNILYTIFGIVEMVGSVVVLVLIYKLNRKNVIYVASGIMVTAGAILVIYKFFRNSEIEIIPSWVVVVCVYTYTLISTSALSSSFTVILSEIQQAYYRAEMTSFNAGTSSLFLALYSFVFPYVKKILPIEYILIFFIVNIVLSVITIFIFFPETSKLEFFETKKKKSSENSTSQ